MKLVRIPFRSLTIWALLILKDTAECAGASPIVPTTELRLALAWLASVRPDERSALDLFWSDAIEHFPGGNDHSKAYRRGLALSSRIAGVAERMLISSELLGDIHRRWKQGLFEGAGETESHAYLKERVAAYREEQKRRAASY